MTLKTKVKKLIKDELLNQWVAILAEVVQVNSPLTCDVQPLHEIRGERPPIIKNVPLAIHKSNGSFVVVKPKVNDVVLVLFNKYNINDIYKTKTSAPIDSRHQHYTNAIVIGGFVTYQDYDQDMEDLSEGDVLIKHSSGA